MVSDDDSIGALWHENKPMKNYSFENEITVYGLFDRSSENEVFIVFGLESRFYVFNMSEILW